MHAMISPHSHSPGQSFSPGDHRARPDEPGTHVICRFCPVRPALCQAAGKICGRCPHDAVVSGYGSPHLAVVILTALFPAADAALPLRR